MTATIVSEIICLIKIRDGRQTDRPTDRQTDRRTDRQTETGDLFLGRVGVMKGRENVKVESRSTDSITILPLLTLRK